MFGARQSSTAMQRGTLALNAGSMRLRRRIVRVAGSLGKLSRQCEVQIEASTGSLWFVCQQI